MKSERMKKLEADLQDLEQWLKLGLVPKKEMDKHVEEIDTIRSKIEEEKKRLAFLKETGDLEDYTPPPPPKKTPRANFQDSSIPGIDDSTTEVTLDTVGTDTESSISEEQESGSEADSDMEDSSFESLTTRRGRWSGIADPDADDKW